MTEWKNSIEIFNNRLYHTEEKKIFKLMDRLFEINKRGIKREKMKNRWRKFPWIMGLSNKWTFIHIMEDPGEDREKGKHFVI